MARKKGFFGTLGTLFRVAVVVLAGILVYAIWQNYSQPDVIAETETGAEDGEQPLEQALEAADTDEVVSDAVQEELEEAANTELPDTEGVDVREEIATATGDAVDAATDAGAQGEEAVEDAEDAAASVSELATDARDQAEETVANLADEAEQAVDEVKDKAETALNDLLNPAGDAASSIAAIKVPGDDTTYAMIEATRIDDGSIEVISQKTGEDLTMTLSRVTCAPLALGVMAAGATPEALETRAEPEMAQLVLGTPEAALAAYACGVAK